MSAVQTYRKDREGIALSIHWMPHRLSMELNGDPRKITEGRASSWDSRGPKGRV